MAPRVRVVVHALDRTGPPMLARSAVVGLREAGFEVDVVSIRSGPMVGEFAAVAPVRVLLDPRDGPERLLDPTRSPLAAARLQHLPSCDLLLLVSVAGFPALDLLAPDPSAVVIAWVVERGEDLRWVDDFAEVTRRVDGWWAGTDPTAREIGDRLGVNVAVVPEFVEDPASYEELAHFRTACGVERDQVMVLGAGICTRRKGVDLFVEAAAEAMRRGLHQLRFVWIGGTDDELYEAISGDLRKPDRPDVRLMGVVSDVRPWIAAADIFLHPARLDAYPLVCLEAGAAGTPVVGFADVSAQEEMFGDAAIVATFPDVQRLADHVEALGADALERRRCGERQRSVVTGRSVASVAVPQLVDAVRTALQ